MKLIDTIKSAVVIMSGGLDSSILARFATDSYGKDNVHALSFFYGQKQKYELQCAKENTKFLGIKHTIFDLPVLNEISMGISANVDGNIDMVTMEDILGDPQPPTYVPNRNMILLSIAAAYAERHKLEVILTGVQKNDEYGYWDTTRKFINAMNGVIIQNRAFKVQIYAPFSDLTKQEEIRLLLDTYGQIEGLAYLANTLTCYNPNEAGESCGVCPSCVGRLKAFSDVGVKDPIKYIER